MWEKNKKLLNLRRSAVDTITQSNGVHSSLTIKNIMMKDSGNYRCKATNIDGNSSVSTEAELISKLIHILKLIS